MPDPSPALDTIFSAAVEIPDPAARAAYLDGACGADPDLRRKAGDLVAAHFRATPDFLERPAAGDETAAFPADAAPPPDPGPAAGTRIGPYKLLEPIGEGGMGTVWLAEQAEPVRRRVALKVIRVGMDSKAVLARFEAERQALALMDHPHIAKVLDAGATPEGRPYFVMELVQGSPITAYCDAHRLTPRARLALFADVCAAVQHAHQKGVIHRDIKPGNVLVGLYDGKPVVKVIDFGVAKAAGQPLTDRTLFTGFGAVVGTPEYMSPEQATLDNVDVDTRSDVYSLGVLLYELLTGTTPVTRERVKRAALLEVLRVVREEDTPRPSTRLSSTDGRASIAAVRGTDPGQLSRLLRGELDWVALRALEKDRSRRYESAAALAADVQRFLADEPVAACPPSAAYRARKFARRNRAALATVGVVAAALVAGTAVSVWQAVEAHAARQAADARYRDEQRARADADRERARAGDNYRRARAAVKQMLTRVATDEVGAIPAMKETRRKLLEDAAAFYTGLLALEPRDAEALFERGNVHAALNQSESAIRDYRAVLEVDPGRADIVMALAYQLFYARNDYRGALAHASRAAAMSPDRCEGYYLAAYAHHHLGEPAESRAALRAYRERAPETGEREAHTAWLHLLWGDPAAALPHARRAVELAPDAWLGQYRLAQALNAVGDYDAAFAAIDSAIRVSRRPNDSSLAQAYTTRGDLHARAGRAAAAAADYTQALGVQAPGSLGTWHVHKRRAAAHFHTGEYRAALADLTTALEVKPSDLSALTWIAPDLVAACPDAAFRRGVLDLADRTVERTGGDPDAYAARAQLHDAMGDGARAREDWAKAAVGSANNPAARAGVLASFGMSLLRAGLFAEAEPVARECLAIREKDQPDAWTTANARSMLGGALLGQGKYAEAEPLLAAGYEGMKQREAAIPPAGLPRLGEAVERLVRLYQATGRAEEAAVWRARLPPVVAPPPRPVKP